MSTIAQLEAAFTRCRAAECTVFVSFYRDKVHVTISKAAYTGSNNLSFNVKGEGTSVTEAFDRCFANFPPNPLDGESKWVSSQLAPPVDAKFTEIP